ncbi:MAG: endonuclease [Arcobacter sp.]|jgi:endonuclease/exonuclease/phosphatase family metal-dependent hydrolase|uniref:endonuclease/exonuclease/phosphatase family protein n=1 Tax=Arcobacter sp. TaxID=1872629 RepID=UPI002A7593DA|nr:endonuclease/exonuclease/phosphatase family protein [Arcobacter sp.]MDY3199774.1 endonuclease [Arcobacter sp.]
MKIRIGTFNLFQFVEPPFSWYTKKEKFTDKEWEEKTAWIKKQIQVMNCDIIGFQEVFSKNALKELLLELGFKYFKTIDKAKIDKKNDLIYISTTVALASKFPIKNLKKVETDFSTLKKHNIEGFFRFAREPIKATIILPNQKEINFYVCHLKSNRENEFEYIFTKTDKLEDKLKKVEVALKNNYSLSLKQRLCEASSLYSDIKTNRNPSILVCDLNDKEFSLTIDALTNKKYHEENLKKDDFLLLDAYHLHKIKVINPHPEFKGVKRTPTSYFAGKGNVLDYIFVSKHFDKNNKFHIGKVTSYEIFDEHLQKNQNGSLLKSDHAQIVCEIEINQ